MYFAKVLSENIKNTAKMKGILIRDLLRECGLNVNSLSQMTDKNGLSSFSLARIADYLDCSVDYLLGRDTTSITVGDVADNHGVIGQANAPVTINNAESKKLGKIEESVLLLMEQLSTIEQAKILVYAESLVKKD